MNILHYMLFLYTCNHGICFCIAVCDVLSVDCCIILQVLQVHCITVVCTVKKISPSETKFFFVL